MIDAWLEAWDRQIGRRAPFTYLASVEPPPLDFTVLRLRGRRQGYATRPGWREHRRGPSLHPTKGYRGAHKLFRGGSR